MLVAVGFWGHAILLPEETVKVAQVGETTIERDIHNHGVGHRELAGGVLHAGTVDNRGGCFVEQFTGDTGDVLRGAAGEFGEFKCAGSKMFRFDDLKARLSEPGW